MEDEERVPQPSYFGTNLDQAKGRHPRVKELWAYLERKYQEPPNPVDVSDFDLEHDRREYRWSGEAIWVARELASGRVQILVPKKDRADPEGYLRIITGLGRRYPMVHFVSRTRRLTWMAETSGRWPSSTGRKISPSP